MSGTLEGATGSRKWIYQLKVKGEFQAIHRISGTFLQLVLFVVPWLQWDGHPLVLADLPGRRLYVLGDVLTPRDTVIVVTAGLFLVFLLFFITSVFGRLWCGYLCPQTVFMEEWVRRIEEFFEGSRASRRAQDRSPWQLGTVLRKTTKTVSILLLSAIISMSLISYFVPARVLWPLEASGLAYSIVAVITALHFIDFIWFREQLCSFLCPYARFQGALTDEHSLVIAYNRARGEPRGKLRKGVRAGACIDCGKCAAVCPQGLDIRDGYQLECINCARCIDACEGVMTRLQAKSLIGYTQLGGEEKPSLLGGRTLAYSTLLVGLAVIFIVLISSRTNFDASIHRSPGTLYTTHADGFVQNSFILNLENHQSGHQEDRRFNISLPDLDNAEVIVPELSLSPGESLNTTLVLRVPQKQLHTRTFPIDFLIESGDDEVRIQTTFKSGL